MSQSKLRCADINPFPLKLYVLLLAIQHDHFRVSGEYGPANGCVH